MTFATSLAKIRVFQDMAGSLDRIVTRLVPVPTDDISNVMGSSEIFDDPLIEVFGFFGSIFVVCSSVWRFKPFLEMFFFVRFVRCFSLVWCFSNRVGGQDVMNSVFVNGDGI